MAGGNHPTLLTVGTELPAVKRPRSYHRKLLSIIRRYSTAFHELTHSTAAQSGNRKLAIWGFRLQRRRAHCRLGAFARMQISCCELPANSTAYIQGWLRSLKDAGDRCAACAKIKRVTHPWPQSGWKKVGCTDPPGAIVAPCNAPLARCCVVVDAFPPGKVVQMILKLK